MLVRDYPAPSAVHAQGLAVSADGKLFWIAWRDGKASLEVWDARAGVELGYYPASGRTASTQMAASRDGSLVAVAGTVGARKPKLWSRTRSTYKATSPDLELAGEVCAMTLDLAPVLVASDNTGTISAWHCEEKRVLARRSLPRAAIHVSTTRDGTILACSGLELIEWDFVRDEIRGSLELPQVAASVLLTECTDAALIGATDTPRGWFVDFRARTTVEVPLPAGWVRLGGLAGETALFCPHSGMAALLWDTREQRELCRVELRAQCSQFVLMPDGQRFLGLRVHPDKTYTLLRFERDGSYTALASYPGRDDGYARNHKLAVGAGLVALLIQDRDDARLVVIDGAAS